MRKPSKLSPGDTIATISLSWGGPGTFPHRYAIGKRQLQETFGINVVETRHALKDAAWLARHPEARAEDLMQAFADPSIKGIISTIGGDDSIRLLPYLDLGVIQANPKIFLGYSDTTVTHLACYTAGVVSFYGPSIMAGFGENGGIFPYTIDAIRRTLFSSEPIGVIPVNTDGWTVEMLDWADPSLQSRRRALQPATGWRFLQGTACVQGHLIGGCLEVLDWLRGTRVWPNHDAWNGAILFLETSEEAPSPVHVTRVLRNFAAMGILDQIAALLFGRPGGGIAVADFMQYDQAILQVVAEEHGLTQLPIVTHMDFGHTDPMWVLPYGVQAQVDCEHRSVAILDNAVTEEAG
jgi:muramoyltetrapeptide carboxypeptidase LdcA involved in peptidoglycan recycling